ncbi:unnamed protein product, partial [marine sediment metagenome]
MNSKIVCSVIASFVLTGAVARCQEKKQEVLNKPGHCRVPGVVIDYSPSKSR